VLIGDAGVDDLNGGDGADECDGETEVDCELDPQPVTTGLRIQLLSDVQRFLSWRR
jgi:hypothetical protein